LEFYKIAFCETPIGQNNHFKSMSFYRMVANQESGASGLAKRRSAAVCISHGETRLSR
jgi:hypothetical protein